MIGHVFTTSGAVCLAIAPSRNDLREYVVLARVETGYAVAEVALRDMPTPTSWLRASYYDCHGADKDLREAVADFCRDTLVEPGDAGHAKILRRVRYAETLFADTIAASLARLNA